MNTTALKRFAANARVKIKSGVALKLMELGFDGEGHVADDLFPQQIQGATLFRGQYYPEEMYGQWNNLYNRVQEKGIREVYEEVAYTWFNRIVAIRILQKNDLIAPVLNFVEGFTRIPQIVLDAKKGRFPEMSSAERMRLQAALQDESKVVEQFTILLTAFCHSNPILKNCFGRVSDYTELLLPNDILSEGGFIDMINHTDYITDEDYRTTELLGWLYQFYIAERKDEVFASFKNGKKAAAEDIPAATQIFTPNWIVKYMVENTIGRIYLDNEPYSDLKEQMPYLVDIEPVPAERQFRYTDLAELTMVDPACGSGHILLEGFELLMKMYQEGGYTTSQSIEQIFRHNLLGIELDTRAKQLSTFALMLKACQNDRSFADAHVMPRVLDMPKVDVYTWRDLGGHMAAAYGLRVTEKTGRELESAFELLKEADNLGSIMKFNVGDEAKRVMREALEAYERDDRYTENFAGLMHGFRLVLALTDKYAAVVANPPYMGNVNMNDGLSFYVKDNYSAGKADLCTVFVQVFRQLSKINGSYAYIIPPSWLFLSGFEALRRTIIEEQQIESLLHLSRGVFGADFGSVASVIRNSYDDNATGTYFRLVERTFQEFEQDHLRILFEKTLANHDFKFYFADYSKDVHDIVFSEAGAKIYYPFVKHSDFAKIPGCPIGYWVSSTIIDSFEKEEALESIANPRKGLVTLDDSRFIHFWMEISKTKFQKPGLSKDEVLANNMKWVVCNKGGGGRKWYGLNWYVINWLDNGQELKDYIVYKYNGGSYTKEIRSENLYFKNGITWSGVTSGNPSFRYFEPGCIFSSSGPSAFPEKNIDYILAVLNSSVSMSIFKLLSPTLSVLPGDIAKIPIKYNNIEGISHISRENQRISALDWDMHETSWNFQFNEFVALANNNSCGLSTASDKFKEKWTSLFYQLQTNEEELNRQFIEIYGLQDELTPDVPLDDVTILQQGEISIDNNKIVWNEDVLMKQLISYAVGVWMGRYRLDKPGLYVAHPNPSIDELAAYEYQGSQIEIDDDAIIPILPEDSPFADNLYNRIKEFVLAVFDRNELTQNLNYIEKALGKSINEYLQKDFFADHKKMYQNRPIYWLFSSKKGAFRCLVYMHRMDAYTAEKVRSKYLLPYMESLRQKIDHLRENDDLTGAQRRELTNLQKAYDECQEYHERLHTVAGDQITFDLDDGVVVNYAKFGDVLAKLK